VKPEDATGTVATQWREPSSGHDRPRGLRASPRDPKLPPDGPELPGPSVKLALIVVLLAVGIVVVGLIAMVAWGSTKPASAPSSVATAKGSPIAAIPAAPDLAPLVSGGEPPNDIVNALVLPKGSVAGAVIDDTDSAESYDEERIFTLGAAEQKIITFFEVELPAQGWHVESTGPPKNLPGFEVLAQRAGSDGYYWEVGAVISPTAFSGPNKSISATQFEFRLFQVNDDTG
jgi:hypothetical protein